MSMQRLSTFSGDFTTQLIADSQARLQQLRTQAQQPRQTTAQADFVQALTQPQVPATKRPNSPARPTNPAIDSTPTKRPQLALRPRPTELDEAVVTSTISQPAISTLPQQVEPKGRPTTPPASSSMAYENQLNQLVMDVQTVAQQSGFIGVNRDDVVKAYKNGQSFLADYTV